MKKIVKNGVFDQERALYNLCDAQVVNCRFEGEADGESALKECRNVEIDGSTFVLRYPLWHAKGFNLKNSQMATSARAPIWYTEDGVIENCRIESIKTLRDCKNTKIKNSYISSEEFGWKCDGIEICNSEIESVYFLLDTKNVTIDNLKMKGKYSFQYTENIHIKNSYLDTKDAFWHTKNLTVENSTVKGEYLGWFSDGLTLINCHISGTQPLCYCKNLKLVNCTMEDTDLSFEYSSVEADIKGHIVSVKNPQSGYINADSIGEIILEDSVVECDCKITTRKSK